MIHLPSSPNVSHDHIPPQRFKQDVKIEKLILDQHPAEVVDIALHALQKAGVELIEWRALLYRRMDVPVRAINYSYVIPDDDLIGASDILSRLGLPLSPPSKLSLNCAGDFSARGRSHRITRTKLPSGAQHLILYPLSFSTLSYSEVTEQPPFHIQPSLRCTRIFVPRRSAVYASIIRMMLKYPHYCATRVNLQSDLSELIGYDLLGLDGGYVDPEEDDIWKDLMVDERICDAVSLVRQWSWDQEWREGEEWIGDALAAVVGGNDIEHLPFQS